ncbi:energy transducer TonB [Novosphingobium aquiterrae]|uniref:Energy transducer TonB n=1 Tax=Novosphingobium aquiterrae TaxID=624388 RepID=A0ABV6PFF9_9SPHN
MDSQEDELDISSPRRVKIGVAIGVVLLQVAVVLGLIRAFAPDFAAKAVDAVVSTFTVTVTTPPPKPPEPPREEKMSGASGEIGKKAVPRETKAPVPKIPIAKSPAPKAASTGSADTSGAKDRGTGTGAGGTGSGTGSGAGGNGDGGGAASKAVHISGQLNSARDFPIPAGGREARIGKSVIIALTVSPSGRATACKVYRPSGLPDTDAATCRLAMDKLRFKPAMNSAGEPVTSTFYWQQKFFF